MYTQLTVFDLDHTLVKGNSSFRFCHYLFKRKILTRSSLLYSLICYFQFLQGQITTRQLHEKVFCKVLKGKAFQIIENEITPFLEDFLSNALYLPAFESLRLAQHLGHYTLILSNSPSFLVKPIAQLFSVNEWKATEYEVDNQGKLCHISSIMEGQNKAEYVRQMIQRLQLKQEDITVYSDSYLDLPVLLTAGKAIAVNPDRKLRKYFYERHWRVI